MRIDQEEQFNRGIRMTTSSPASPAAAWHGVLGIVAIVLGVFLCAFHANEWLKQTVLTGAMPEGAEFSAAAVECPPAELEEEGLSAAECVYMVEHVRGLFLSMPDWFPSAMQWLAGIGALLAFLSVILGGALVNNHPAAETAAVPLFAALALVDLLQFMAVVNAGPIIRDIYLWGVLLWFLLHLMMTKGAIAGRQSHVILPLQGQANQ